jgi:L-cystine transport system permease protein
MAGEGIPLLWPFGPGTGDAVFLFYVWPWIAAGLFGGPQDTMYRYKLSPLAAAVTALSLIFSAYFAETFRADGTRLIRGSARPHGQLG